MSFYEVLLRAKCGDHAAAEKLFAMYRPLLVKESILLETFDEDLYQELLAEDRAREEAQAAEAAAKVAAAQAAAGVLDEDAEVAEAETGTVEE